MVECPSGTVDLNMDPEDGCECLVGVEACDDDDDDCDGRVDEDLTQDCGMMIGACVRGTERCEAGAWVECSATLPSTELCDGTVDENCDGIVDEGCTCTIGTMRPCGTDEGLCVSGVQLCDAGTWSPDCTGSLGPIDEVCDTFDQDCDGATDEGVLLTFYRDADFDTHGNPMVSEMACLAPPGFVETMDDCDDGCAVCWSGQSETCDTFDNDCNGSTDEGVSTVFYRDADSDAYGGTETIDACFLPAGYSTEPGDCNDVLATINPGAIEGCNAIDDDCDTRVDEDSVAPACPCTQASDGGHSYLFCEEDAYWPIAASRCPAGYDLAKIESSGEQTFVWSQVDPIDRDWWIGLRRPLTATSFSWEDGTPLGPYQPWGPLEPRTVAADAAVVMVNATGGAWGVIRQNRARFYVCEGGP